MSATATISTEEKADSSEKLAACAFNVDAMVLMMIEIDYQLESWVPGQLINFVRFDSGWLLVGLCLSH